MKKVLVLMLLTVLPAYADLVSPTYSIRSQGSDTARKLVGLANKIHLYEDEKNVAFSATAEYSRSFDQDKIARCLFGDDLCNCNQIIVQGSSIQGSDRNPKAWFADYFYLAPDYNSYFEINPRIQNALLDLDLFVGLNNIKQGLYVRFHGPITYTNWDLKFEEPCDVVTTGSYDFGYFDSDRMFNSQLLDTFGDFARGNTPLNTQGPTDAINIDRPTLGLQFIPLHYAKIDGCSHSRTGFADLRMELGYDFAQDDDYHVGLNVQLAAPTGNRTQAEFAFDPTVGNRNHWEVGAGLSAHYTFWCAQGEEKHAGIYFDVNITHLNKATEQRTFDLCGRPNSRYMLAMKMGRPVEYLFAGDDFEIPVAQFVGTFSPVANLTTLNIQVSNAIQADLAVMFNCAGENFSFDLGYNFWIRSCDKFSNQRNPMAQCCPSLCDGNRDVWALKGDAHVFGFAGIVNANGFTPPAAVALSATECGATIHNGTNATSSSDRSTLNNAGVDNAQNANWVASNNYPVIYVEPTGIAGDSTSNIVKTSLEPKFINCCDINLQRTRGLSNKVFANFTYTWQKDNCTPYIGIGGFAEFGKNQSECCDTTTTFDCSTSCDSASCKPECCTDCIDCSVSQWGIWLKGGVNFEGMCN